MVTLAFSGRCILMEDTIPLVGHPDGGGGGLGGDSVSHLDAAPKKYPYHQSSNRAPSFYSSKIHSYFQCV